MLNVPADVLNAMAVALKYPRKNASSNPFDANKHNSNELPICFTILI